MPHPDSPDYEPWKQQLASELKHLDGDVLLIGHSLGGSVLLKYLSENQVHFRIKGLYLCASPFWGMAGWDYEPFTLAPDFAKNLPRIDSVHIYHSKNDVSVSYEHAERYKKELPSSMLHPINGASHAYENGIEQLVYDIKSM